MTAARDYILDLDLSVTRLRRCLERAVIVAVRSMGVMHVSTDDVIEMIAVGNAFMPAFWAMSVVASVRFTLVIWRAVVGIGSTDGYRVLVDVAVMEVVHMTIMKIVRMPLVGYSHVPATGTMLVTVFGVLSALTFFHRSPFDQLNTRYDHARAGRRARIRVFSGLTGWIFRAAFRGRTTPSRAFPPSGLADLR